MLRLLEQHLILHIDGGLMADYYVLIEEKLNLIAGMWAPLVVHVKQYDGDYTRQMKFTLYYGESEYTIPSKSTVTISGTKPDGNGFSYYGSFSGSVVTVPVLRQMTICQGSVPCEITLFDADNNQIGSATFILFCDRAALQSSTLESSNDFKTLTGFMDEAKYYWKMSQSYAIGRVGIRPGENTDNSKYYSEQSEGYSEDSNDHALESKYWAEMSRSFVGITPLSTSTASGMTDTDAVYIYTGNETGYNTGDWYYYDGSQWVSGGSYLHVTEDLLSYNIIRPSEDIIIFSEETEEPVEGEENNNG